MREARKVLVGMAIEKTLLEISKPTYNEVLSKLNEYYHCHLSDCYENPKYLSRILKELYGKCSPTIIESIKKHLAEFSMEEDIVEFLVKISE